MPVQYVPATVATEHAALPLARNEEKVPEGHSWHGSEAFAAYVPAVLHAVQAVEAAAGATRPAAQGEHCAEPVTTKEPTGQSWHVLEPVEGAKKPAGHCKQAV